MKKILYFVGAMALMAGFVACEDETEYQGPNFDEATSEGFYVYGEGVGDTSGSVSAANLMAAGTNEANSNALRDGMYEKYVWIEANKDFELALYKGGVQTRYTSKLEETLDNSTGNLEGYGEHPWVAWKHGKLLIGNEHAPMRVAESGMYHIVLDLNVNNDLTFGQQIVVTPVTWGVRGGMNGWGFTSANPVKGADGTITWTWENQELAKNGEFKFANSNGWKITLEGDKVKANTNLGAGSTNDVLLQGGANIKVGDAGKYTIVLSYKNAGGELAKSFSYTATCTEVSTMPETMYIIGNEFGNWKWDAATVVNMVPVWGKAGAFWAVRYMTTATQFKFCAVRDWKGDFCTLTNNSGFVTPDNNQVEADGLYLIMVDLVDDAVTVKPAAIYGMGNAFGSWDVATHAATVNANGTVSLTTTAAGDLRMYSDIGHGDDWWHSEFNIYDGKIVYRGGGNDQAAVAVEAGKTITLDFFNESATIQ